MNKERLNIEPIKGLSGLQKKILRIAHKNQGTILARDVLAEVYGFPLIASNIQCKKVGGMVFNRGKIGPKRYQAASVAVARSFSRLAARGLVHRQYNHGITLTRAGVKVAKEKSGEF